ncbi:metal ABC transporter permease [Micromonospora sp. NPDC049559]|uniref:metal ABC transporter permease n=1 Tax=Micromonospora sp. NPDC049559 TaxID=3155923 RepID=UPI0034435856
MSWLRDATDRAMVESVVVGTLAGAIGVQIVLRRLAFFTMTMTHATFPGVVAAAVVGINIYLGGALVGLLVTLAVVALGRRRGQDLTTATGVLLSAGFALGVALAAAQQGFTRNLSAYLVGAILTVSDADLVTGAAVCVVVLAVLFAAGKELRFAGFDPDGARAAGYRTRLLDLLLLLLVEAVVVVVIPAVGTILALALLVAPASAARLWTDRPGPTTGLAVAFGVASSVAGLALSSRYDLAAGATISLVATGVLGGSLLAAPRHGVLARPTSFRRSRANPRDWRSTNDDLP